MRAALPQAELFPFVFASSAASRLEAYFEAHSGSLFELMPTAFVVDGGGGGDGGGDDGDAGGDGAGGVAASAGWLALAGRYKQLKARRYVNEAMPSKQCVLTTWLVKSGVRAQEMQVLVLCVRGLSFAALRYNGNGVFEMVRAGICCGMHGRFR